MVLGDAMSVMLELEVDISQLAKLKVARERIDRFQRSADRGFGQLNKGASKSVSQLRQMGVISSVTASELAGVASMSLETGNAASTGLGRLKGAASRARGGISSFKTSVGAAVGKIASMTGGVQALRMAMLNMMFTGLNLAFVFGGILALSPRVRAGFMAVVGALRLVAIEAGKILLPHLLNLAQAIRNLDEDQRNLIARIAIVGTMLGVLMGIVGILGQAFLTVGKGALLFGKLLMGIAKFIPTIVRGVATLGRVVLPALYSAFQSIAAFAAGTLVPALSTTAVSIAGISIPIWAVIAAIGALIGAFLEFEVIRQAVADGLGFLYEVWKNIGNILVYLGESVFNQLILGFLKIKKWVETTEDSMLRFANSIIGNVVGAINKLIGAVNQLAAADPTGMIPSLSKIDTSDFQFDVDTSNIDKLNDKIKEFQSRQANASLDFQRRMRENDEAARKLSSDLKNLFNAHKDQKVGNMIGGLIDDVSGALGMGGGAGVDGKMLSGQSMSQRGINRQFGQTGQTQQVDNRKIENNVTLEEPTIEENVDVDRLMDDIEERLERNQRRKNNQL